MQLGENQLRESIAVACLYASSSSVQRVVSRAEFISSWSSLLQELAAQVWDAQKIESQRGPDTHLIMRRLAAIGAKSLDISIPGPNKSTLHWYSMKSHVVIFQCFDDAERWEIYTSLDLENKAALKAASVLSSLASPKT